MNMQERVRGTLTQLLAQQVVKIFINSFSQIEVAAKMQLRLQKLIIVNVNISAYAREY
jgi:hypothetical protein